jgi:N-ethylmaleimide reductase
MKNVLFSEFKLNSLFKLKNRILMAPMTRAKADTGLVPTVEMAEYYARRADAGLIITEGVVIAPDASGYSTVPGIFSAEQIEKWKLVSQRVHARGGLIFMQIWHVGRVSHPNFLNGNLPIAPSETVMKNRVNRSPDLFYGKSRAASLQEIQKIIQQYATAAKNAIEAGFDGVEIHGANGYLIDQFLHFHTNHRTDEYGGTPENMSRFALEVVKACGEAIGFERVGLRLSPGAYLHEIESDLRDGVVFEYLLEKLNAFPIAYVHTGNFDDTRVFPELNQQTMTDFIRQHYRGVVVACGSYTVEKAQQGLARGDFDLVAMGRPFIANHNFIEKIQLGLELKNYEVGMLNSLD